MGTSRKATSTVLGTRMISTSTVFGTRRISTSTVFGTSRSSTSTVLGIRRKVAFPPALIEFARVVCPSRSFRRWACFRLGCARLLLRAGWSLPVIEPTQGLPYWLLGCERLMQSLSA